MKLRQKLAVVLASAMAVTAVPVVTMANTSNKIVRYASAIKKDVKTTTAGYLGIKFEDNDLQYEEEFYFELTNADWLKADDDKDIILNSATAYGAGAGAVAKLEVYDKTTMPTTLPGLTEDFSGSDFLVTFVDGSYAFYNRQNDKTMKVNFVPATATDQYVFPFPIKATGGVISVATKVEGSGSSITEGSYSFAATGEKAATLEMADLKSFYDEGELTAIKLKESFAGSLLADTTNDQLILKIQLDDTDWVFRSSSDVEVVGTYGFDFTAKQSKPAVVNGKTITTQLVFDGDDDDNTAYVIIKGLNAAYGSNTTNANNKSAARSQGRLEIKGLKVMADEDEDLAVGELKADIKAVKDVTVNNVNYKSELELDKDYNGIAVAKIATYGASIVMKDEKAVDIKAGRTKEVEFKVVENIDDCFVEGRKITIDLESEAYKDSYFMIDYKGKGADYSNLISDKVDGKAIIKSVEVQWHDDNVWDKSGNGVNEAVTSKDITAAGAIGKKRKADAIIVTLQDDNNDAKNALNKNNRIDWFKVKTDLYVPLGQYDKKDLKLTGSMRGIDDETFLGCTAANIIKPFTVEAPQTTLKVGLQDQKATKVVVTETDKEMFQKGALFLNINNGSKINQGFAIDNKGTLTATGSLKTTDFDNTATSNKFYLKRDSNAASSITIDGWEVTVDRTVPEGYYDLEIKGTAVDDYDGCWKVADFVKIGTANPQDLVNANGLAAATASFTIDSASYVVNGTSYTMDGAAAYIAGEGYTMIPVRYVASAFGVSEKNILFGNGTATIFAGARTIQLTSGSNVAIVNGAQVKLATKVVNKDGRIYVPVGEVANILGVSKAWDADTKTATFTNVNTVK